MNDFKFLNTQIYKDSNKLYKELRTILLQLQSKREFSIYNQLERASLSIVLNIAEGWSRKFNRDFQRFMEIALGSLNEVVACLNIIRTIHADINPNYENLDRYC